MHMIKKSINFSDTEIKFIGDKGRFTGYASVFNGLDSYGDTIRMGAFQSAIKFGRSPKMFENHKSWELPIGKWVSVVEDSKGLLVEGEFTPNHAKADMVRAAMLHGTLDGLSIGFRMKEGDYEFDGDVRVIKNISELVEISPVTFPADDDARVDLSSVKSALVGIKTVRDLEIFLREEGGFSNGVVKAFIAQSKAIFTQEVAETGLEDEAISKLRQSLFSTPIN